MRVKSTKRYDVFIQAIVNGLAIEYVNIHWRATLNKNVAGCAYRDGNVYIKKYMGDPETLRVIAHELRHIWQFQTGIFPNENTWNNTTYTKLRIKRGTVPSTYYEQPWEKDAEDYAVEAIRIYGRLVK